MAQENPTKIPILFLAVAVLLLALAISTKQAKELNKETTKMSLYLQDYSAGENATSASIAGIAGKIRTVTQFGTVYVADDPMTETPDPASRPVGRSQGTYVVAGLDGRNLGVVLSLVFTNDMYNGSTIELQGSYRQFEAGTEVSVVGGTGKFRLARGFATFETFLWDVPNSHATLRLNVTVVHG